MANGPHLIPPRIYRERVPQKYGQFPAEPGLRARFAPIVMAAIRFWLSSSITSGPPSSVAPGNGVMLLVCKPTSSVHVMLAAGESRGRILLIGGSAAAGDGIPNISATPSRRVAANR